MRAAAHCGKRETELLRLEHEAPTKLILSAFKNDSVRQLDAGVENAASKKPRFTVGERR